MSTREPPKSQSYRKSPRLITTPVYPNMLVIRNRFEQPQDMFAGFPVEAIGKHSVRRAHLACQFQFRIVYAQLAILFDSQFAPHLQGNLHSSIRVIHTGVRSNFISATPLSSERRQHPRR
jgi:hypothetical protein